jgi:hypothetical protein
MIEDGLGMKLSTALGGYKIYSSFHNKEQILQQKNDISREFVNSQKISMVRRR